MALSNKFGWIVLTTGNKSEIATGYATLYGDMAGGFAVIKDVPKTLVYASPATATPWATAGHPRGRHHQAADRRAEARPARPGHAAALRGARPDPRGLRRGRPQRRGDRRAGLRRGHRRRVVHMINRNEYKRRQAPPGVKITPRAFGRDRRLPIAHRYRGT